MIFNIFEVTELQKINEEKGGSLDNLDDDEEQFLLDLDIMRFQRNYIILPKTLSRRSGAHNIVLISLLGPSFDLLDYINSIVDCLTPPFYINIDFGVLLFHPTDKVFRYIWPQRSTSLPIPPRVMSEEDREQFMSKFSNLDISRAVLEQKQTQSQFDKSGFILRKFLTVSVFLSKIKV